ncbi:hypothetical protein CRG98_041267 [Punica granatum]|uniref:Uncharacterized protein n=1 Tax=Punica granatum TaxID=22663 RepID=A0A2I0I4I7_PUNGR|nr:hypothetical protein CRG98_041267 [Punica granatum]
MDLMGSGDVSESGKRTRVRKRRLGEGGSGGSNPYHHHPDEAVGSFKSYMRPRLGGGGLVWSYHNIISPSLFDFEDTAAIEKVHDHKERRSGMVEAPFLATIPQRCHRQSLRLLTTSTVAMVFDD